MPAFEYAVDLGYRYLETDVQVTADGVLVAFHDDDLQPHLRPRRQDQRAAVVRGVERRWSTARRRSRCSRTCSAPGPTLRINIDCKTDAAVDALVAALRRTDSLDRVCVGGVQRPPAAPAAQGARRRSCARSLGPLETRAAALRPAPQSAAAWPRRCR